MRLLKGPKFDKSIARLSAAEREQMDAVVRALPEIFGRPHAHLGAGVRKLAKDTYEARAGLQWRVVFQRRDDALELFKVMNHDEVRRWLEGR